MIIRENKIKKRHIFERFWGLKMSVKGGSDRQQAGFLLIAAVRFPHGNVKFCQTFISFMDFHVLYFICELLLLLKPFCRTKYRAFNPLRLQILENWWGRDDRWRHNARHMTRVIDTWWHMMSRAFFGCHATHRPALRDIQRTAARETTHHVICEKKKRRKKMLLEL